MNKAKFTPGPWEVADFFWLGSVPPDCTEWRTENKSVHSVEGFSICMVQGDSGKPMESNAALIAAAPDMYEALINALRDMDKIDQVCKMAGVHEFSLMRAEIENTLAKANGGK